MERWEMQADDLVVMAIRSWRFRKWLVPRSLSQSIPFFKSAPERERRGEERIWVRCIWAKISSFFFLFDSTEVIKTTVEHSRWWSNTKKLFMESTATNVPLQLSVCLSLSSLFFMFLFCFFSLSFVYPSHLSSVTYEGSEANIAIMAQGHGHASRALTGNLPYPSLLYFIFFYIIFLFTNNNIPYGRCLHVLPPIYISPSRMPRSLYVYYNLLPGCDLRCSSIAPPLGPLAILPLR